MSKKKKPKDQNEAWGRLRDAALPKSSFFNQLHEPHAVTGGLTAPRLQQILAAAEAGNPRELFLLYRDIFLGDSHLLSELSKRKMAVLRLPVTFSPGNPQAPEDVQAAELMRLAWDALPGKIAALTHLLDGSVWPVAVAEKSYEPSAIPGLRYQWSKISPVPAHLLNYTEGEMAVEELDEKGLPQGRWHKPCGHIIHRGHMLLSTPDNFGGPMRAGLFWWLFKTMDRAWWIRFLERYASPFTVIKYDDGRPDTKAELERAVAAATRLFGLVVTAGTDVQLMQANASSSGDAFEKFKEVADRELSKLIIGQTSSSEARSGGLNNGQADLHAEVRSEYEEFDAICLTNTLQDQMVGPLLRLNSLSGKVKIRVGRESSSSLSDTLKILETLGKAGLALSPEGLPALSSKFGLPIVMAEKTKGDQSQSQPFSDYRDKLSEILASEFAPEMSRDLAEHLPDPGSSPADFRERLVKSLRAAGLSRSQASLARALAAYTA